MNFLTLAITLFFFGLSGWFTIRVIVKSLFYPRKPVHIFGVCIQGIFPQRKQEVIQAFGAMISNEIPALDQLQNVLINPDNLAKLKPDIEAGIDNFLRNKLKIVFPMLAPLMGEKTIVQLKEAFLAELGVLFPVLMKSYLDKIKGEINPAQLIKEKLNAIAERQLERLLQEVIKKASVKLQLTGLIAGSLIGVAYLLVIFIITNNGKM